jgi:hypothetical protein
VEGAADRQGSGRSPRNSGCVAIRRAGRASSNMLSIAYLTSE